MFWVIQDNLQREGGFFNLVEALDRQGVPYHLTKIVPFSHELVDDFEVPAEHKDVMCIGSMAMRNVAFKKGWFPGVFDENLDHTTLQHHYGEHMLNHDAVFCRFGDIEKVWDRFFLRPVGETKQFTGQVFDWDEFVDWRKSVEKIDRYSTLTMDDVLVMAPIKQIYAEWRFFIVDGKVVTGSMYKHGDRVVYSDMIPEYVTKFAQDMADLWCPNRAFDLDVCETSEGMRIVEINSINSAGFYACDMGKFVNAINNMQFSEYERMEFYTYHSLARSIKEEMDREIIADIIKLARSDD